MEMRVNAAVIQWHKAEADKASGEVRGGKSKEQGWEKLT